MSESRVSDPGLRQSPLGPDGSPTSPRILSNRVGSGPCPCSGIWHGPDQTLSLVGSGRVVSKFHYTDHYTRPDQTCPRLRLGLRPSLFRVKWTTDFVCDPTRPDPRTKSVHIEIERISLRPDKVRGLVGDPSGSSVWSGVLFTEVRFWSHAKIYVRESIHKTFLRTTNRKSVRKYTNGLSCRTTEIFAIR